MKACRHILLTLVIAGCASTPPEDPDDVCEIFIENRSGTEPLMRLIDGGDPTVNVDGRDA